MQKNFARNIHYWKHRINTWMIRILHFAKPLVLPLLIAIFPPVFLYGNNASILLLPSLVRMLIFYSLTAIFFYFCFLLFKIHQPTEVANATFVFLIFFNIYGPIYDYLLKLDFIQIKHYSLLPFYIFLAINISWLITKIRSTNATRLWNGMTFILGILLIFNIAKIIPAEIKKSEKPSVSEPVGGNTTVSADQGYPDIYYIIFDEFAGFDSMREYWHNQDVDKFIQILKNRGFFVAEKSHGSSIDTLLELATRLNYQVYSQNAPDAQKTWFDAISDNLVMRYLKSHGYKTVVFDETHFAYPSAPSVLADYSYNNAQTTAINWGFQFDEFGIMTADSTMMRAFSKLYKLADPSIAQHRNMIFFTLSKVADLPEVPSPKFVYVHLLLPHFPFMFNENGNLVDPKYYYNWNYYLGNYQFSIHIAEQMVDNILSNANPDHPPIIILQSDHGARNLKTGSPDSVILENYPDNLKTNILFAMFIPGYDTSGLPQDLNPINTFPIIFNYLFNANIQLK